MISVVVAAVGVPYENAMRQDSLRGEQRDLLEPRARMIGVRDQRGSPPPLAARARGDDELSLILADLRVTRGDLDGTPAQGFRCPRSLPSVP